MKLSDYKNEDALELVADMLEPISKIFTDKEIVKMVQSNAPKIKIVSRALKTYSKECIEVLALIEGIPADEYDGNIAKMTMQLLEIVNDEEFAVFFT